MRISSAVKVIVSDVSGSPDGDVRARVVQAPRRGRSDQPREEAGTGRQCPGRAPNRAGRRKAHTRAALIRAARRLIAEGRLDAPIVDITEAADVATGSFYNHFASREALFSTALAEATDEHGELLDRLVAGLEDPAEILACGFRLSGRPSRAQPELGRVLRTQGAALMRSDRGLVPRAGRHLEAGIRSGRFTVGDADLALAVVVGAWICLGEVLSTQPERDPCVATDEVTMNLLRMLGIPAGELAEICRRPLPDIPSAAVHGSTTHDGVSERA